MNYQNIDHEIKEYSTYFKYCDSITSKFYLFLKEFSKSGSRFILKSKKLVEDIYSEINKEEYFSSTLNKNINNVCEELKESMDKLQTFFTRIETDIVDKITEFDKDYKSKNRNYLNKLNDLNLYLTENKIKLEKTKNNYFDSCKNISDFEKKYLSNKQKENMKEEEYNKLKDQLEKLKQTSETKKVYYRIEVTKLNDLLVSNENYYLEIINSIAKQEEEKSQFYVKVILLFNNGIKEFNFENKESIARNEKYIDEIYVKRDLKLFTIYFNRINTKEKNRFLYEEFLDYENFNVIQNKNVSGENNSQNNDNSNNVNDNDIKDISKIDFKLASQIVELGQEPFIDIDTMDNEFIELDNIIFNLIQRDEKIDDEKFLRIINFVDANTEGCKSFIYLLMGHYCLKNLVKFNNIENIYLLSTILNMIINYIWDNDDLSYLSFLILQIGEKTIFYNSSDKYPTHYLSKIMSKNTIYHMNDFWYKIINLKIKMYAKIKLNDEFYLKRKNSVSKKDTGIISKFFGGNDNNEKIERDILYSQIYKDKASLYCSEILSEYIIHFMNYDFMNKNTTALIEQLSSQYDLNAKQKNYFLEMINSNIIYIKSFNPYFSDNKSDIIKYENQEDLDKLCFDFNSNKKFKFTKNTKIKILLFVMKYLNNNDIISILSLNRECNTKLKKIVYKNILLKYNNKIELKKHISIWKMVLNYNLIKKKYDYKSILESINKEKTKDAIFDIIELDVIRTSFANNQELNQIKLGNILKATSKELPTVNYCQGMNHIAAFLLILCNEDEEETFYLFLSILFATDYCSLIVNDLFKLNSFFYCFERLLNIIFPEMNSYFKNINVDGGYFLSPWFITLFTNAFNDQKGKENLKIMIKIFDLFLLSGWKAIFKIGLGLIRFNSIKIFSLPYEQLIHYLNNEIMNSDFFKDENYNELMNISINFKISNNLINSLCKEYEMKRNIMNKNK